MASHPINLAVRFLLEVAALLAIGFWGWSQSIDWPRFGLAIGLPLIAAVLWGTFTVPNDPSRSGKAPVPTPGLVRLLLELGFFVIAAWALYDVGAVGLSWTLSLIVLIHYAVSSDRIIWLVKQ